MNYGMYMAASSVSTNMARQDVLSNNLANVNTVGFRPDQFMIRQRDPVRVEDHLPFMDSDRMLERLGAGVMPMATRVSQAQGALQQTGSPLDVAIQGDGYLVVRINDPKGDGVRFTRDGRLTVGPDSKLVTSAGGATVLGESDQPIYVDSNKPIAIDSDGNITQDGGSVGRLQVQTVPNASQLVKDGDNLLTGPARKLVGRTQATGSVTQGSIEMSGTDAIAAMIAVTTASQAAQSGLNVISSINELMGRVISLGRVSA